MILNPRRVIDNIPNTPFVRDARTQRYIGARLLEMQTGRLWTIQSFLLPYTTLPVEGMRTKLLDEQGYITCCAQNDLEILLGLAIPNSKCPWSDNYYSEPGEPEWRGFCLEEEDLLDDLYERELLDPNIRSVTRSIHLEDKQDMEETLVLINPLGLTTKARWVRAERVQLPWKKI